MTGRARRLPAVGVAAATITLALPGAGEARQVSFGSTLNQPPTHFDPPATCDPTGADRDVGPCTRVAVGFAATGAVSNAERSPVSGTIRRVRIRAAAPDTLRVTLARVDSFDREGGQGRARVVSRGRLVRLRGRGLSARPVESFRANMRVRRGDYLALEGSSFTAIRCQGGDTEQLVFTPALEPFAGFESSEYFDDCTPLVQATVSTPRRARRR